MNRPTTWENDIDYVLNRLTREERLTYLAECQKVLHKYADRPETQALLKYFSYRSWAIAAGVQPLPNPELTENL